jgi:chromosome segregation ATPase
MVMNTPRAWSVFPRLIVLSMAVVLLIGLSGAAQQPRATPEELSKARDEVKRLTADLDKVYDQFVEMRRRLQASQDKLDELEGRPVLRRYNLDWPGSLEWLRAMDRRRETTRPSPPPVDPAKAADLEKRLEKLMKDLEDLRRDFRRPP